MATEDRIEYPDLIAERLVKAMVRVARASVKTTAAALGKGRIAVRVKQAP
jgi:hypothetical protein